MAKYNTTKVIELLPTNNTAQKIADAINAEMNRDWQFVTTTSIGAKTYLIFQKTERHIV